MDCKAAKKLAFFYADEKLNSEEMAKVQQHCATCTSCQTEINAAITFVQVMQESVTYVEPPVDFHANVMQNIAELQLSVAGKVAFLPDTRKAWFKRYGLGSVAAVAVCAMLLIPAINNAQLGEQLIPQPAELTLEQKLPVAPETQITTDNSTTKAAEIIKQTAVAGENITGPAVVAATSEQPLQTATTNTPEKNQQTLVPKAPNTVEEAPPKADLPVVISSDGGIIQMASGADLEMLKTRIVTSVLPDGTRFENTQSYENISPNAKYSLDYVDGKYVLKGEKIKPLSKELIIQQKIAWSADSLKIALSSYDGFSVIDVVNGSVHNISAYGGNEIAWSNSSKKVAFTDTENTLYVAALSTSGTLLKVEKLAKSVLRLAWTAQDELQYLVLAEDGSIKLSQATWK
ncbi:MAG: hypothetical protein WCI30_09010 [Clostridia bacterium]